MNSLQNGILDKLPSVINVITALSELLTLARNVKTPQGILPLLTADKFRLTNLSATELTDDARNGQYSVFAAAARRIFYSIIASTCIDDDEFVDMWNLLDIILINGDVEICDPGLVCLLIEELFDSQSVSGCRRVFEYLETRRERLTAKHFSSKQTRGIVTLRSCSDLLRRHSRAENAIFCGRVLIFLFQCFPLGEKGSVNLKGKFHTESVAGYFAQARGDDIPSLTLSVSVNRDQKVITTRVESDESVTLEDKLCGNNSISRINHVLPEKIDLDELYPEFWSLQEYFANPPLICNETRFGKFKHALDVTLKCFQSMPSVTPTRNAHVKRTTKRKFEETGDEYTTIFYPKYLTSRAIFRQQLHDLTFQRNILVQILITLEFLLSLTEKSESRFNNLPNKHVQYAFTLNSRDTDWVLHMKARCAAYLQDGPEGKFFYRMVDTVLSRDKNWLHWKLDNCPPIARPSVSPGVFRSSLDTIIKMSESRDNVVSQAVSGTSDLKFLKRSVDDGLAALRQTVPRPPPNINRFVRQAQTAQLDMDMTDSPRDRHAFAEVKNLNVWRAFRYGARFHLSKLGALSPSDVSSLNQLLRKPKETNAQRPFMSDTNHSTSSTTADLAAPDVDLSSNVNSLPAVGSSEALPCTI